MQPLKFRSLISSHALLGMWLLIHAGIKVNPCLWKGHLVTLYDITELNQHWFKVMACYLTAPNHKPIFSGVLWHSRDGNFINLRLHLPGANGLNIGVGKFWINSPFHVSLRPYQIHNKLCRQTNQLIHWFSLIPRIKLFRSCLVMIYG